MSHRSSTNSRAHPLVENPPPTSERPPLAAARGATIAIIGNRDIVRFRGWLMRDLRETGHRVVACAPANNTLMLQLQALRVEFEPVTMARTGINPLRDAASVISLVRALRRFRPDVVLTHSTKANLVGALAARLAGIQHVFVMIEGLGYAFTSGREWKRRLLRSALSLAFRMAFRRVSSLIVLNETDRVFVRSAGFVGSEQAVVRVNGTGIDLEEFAWKPLDNPWPPRFLLIARLLREKGVVEFAHAARMLRERWLDARFLLVGPFDSNPGALSRTEVESWQRQGWLEYAGETDDVRPFIRDCTVYVLPSYREGMPRTVMEAAAIGRAVVTTDVPGCREALEPGVNGVLVPPRNAQALADAMSRFIENPELALHMGQASRRYAERVFDVRQVNNELMLAMGVCRTRQNQEKKPA